jgi:hypothetical protein
MGGYDVSTDTQEQDGTVEQGTPLPAVPLPAGRGIEARKAREAAEAAEAAKPKRIIVVAGERFPWPSDYTGRELQFVQQETGIRAGELEEALSAGDVSALVALVVIALRRSGREDATMDEILDLSIGAEDGLNFEEEVPTDAADVAASSEDSAAPTTPKSKGGGAASGRRRTGASTG